MLGDYYKQNPCVAAVVDSAIEVIKWFNNHSFALGLLNTEQAITYNDTIWALIVPIITRWTSHTCSLSRLLQVNKAMKLTATWNRDELINYVGPKVKSINKAKRVLDRVLDNNWWKEVAMFVISF